MKIHRTSAVGLATALLAMAGIAAAALYSGAVKLVDDGDTFRLKKAVQGRTTVRVLGIDTPERQQSFGSQATDNLKALLPVNSAVSLETDVQEVDGNGRLLAYATNSAGVLAEQDQLSKGLAVTFAVWPNMKPNLQPKYAEFRNTQIAARAAGLGIWSSLDANPPTMQYPFVHRNETWWLIGDATTKKYVAYANYALVNANNRVFFFSAGDAASAGYQQCVDLNPACFGGPTDPLAP